MTISHGQVWLPLAGKGLIFQNTSKAPGYPFSSQTSQLVWWDESHIWDLSVWIIKFTGEKDNLAEFEHFCHNTL